MEKSGRSEARSYGVFEIVSLLRKGAIRIVNRVGGSHRGPWSMFEG